jgi:hypothetical protein
MRFVEQLTIYTSTIIHITKLTLITFNNQF